MTKETDEHARLVVREFQKAICRELDRKQRLGHYAVVMENGKPTRISPARIREILKEICPPVEEDT